jgi:hypothetical protein
VFDSIRGTSDCLEAGSHSNVGVSLNDPYESDGTAIAMAHLDSNDDERHDFPSSEGGEDGPYVTDGGDPILDDAALTVEMDNGMEDTETNDGGSDGDGAGFGALVASVLAAHRPN